MKQQLVVAIIVTCFCMISSLHSQGGLLEQALGVSYELELPEKVREKLGNVIDDDKTVSCIKRYIHTLSHMDTCTCKGDALSREEWERGCHYYLSFITLNRFLKTRNDIPALLKKCIVSDSMYQARPLTDEGLEEHIAMLLSRYDIDEVGERYSTMLNLLDDYNSDVQAAFGLFFSTLSDRGKLKFINRYGVRGNQIFTLKKVLDKCNQRRLNIQ